MANIEGTRWRGKIPIPQHAHPLVRLLVQLANQDNTTMSEVAKRAGLRPATVSAWRYSCTPRLDNFEACINALGYDIKIVERRA